MTTTSNIIGQTQSGKNIYSNFDNAEHANFDAQDHKDAAKVHYDMKGDWDINLDNSFFEYHLEQQSLHHNASKGTIPAWMNK